ncbi:MAG: DNA repair protein RadC [Bdellovibrionales bacterium]
MPPEPVKIENTNAGHRARLRQRFLDNGPQALADYELLELLLFGAIPQKDTKPLAKELIKAYGSLAAVLNAPLNDLQARFAKQPAIATTLHLAGALAQRMLKDDMVGRTIFSSWQAVLDYCKLSMANLPHEELHLLFLDAKNALIGTEVHQRGTINHTPAYPREVVKRALEKGAAAIILVHNHPSGDPMPSKEDVALTKQIKKAAEILNITLHDHLIIGRGSHISFKAEGLL